MAHQAEGREASWPAGMCCDEAFWNMLGDFVFRLDAQGRMCMINDAALAKLGYRREQAIGRGFAHFVAPEDLPRVQQMFADKQQGKTRHTRYELTILGAHGRRFAAELDSIALFEDGRFAGIFGIARDITAQRQLEARAQAQEARQAAMHAALRTLTAGLHAAEGIEARLACLCDTARRALALESVRIWHMDDARSRLELLHGVGETACAPCACESEQGCLAAVELQGVLAVDDASADLASALAPSQAGSWLAAAIRIMGELVGVAVFARADAGAWQQDEIAFAGELADQVGHMLLAEQYRRAMADLQLAASVFRESPMAIMIADAEDRIVRVNRAFTRITGYREQEVVGASTEILHSGRHESSFFQQQREALERDGIWQGELWSRRKNGELFFEWRSIVCVRQHNGQVRYRISSFADITERKLAELQVKRLAHYDALTNLPNRALFLEQLHETLDRAGADGERVAVVLCDIDEFKVINEMLGHTVGDAILQMVAGHLRAQLGKQHFLARLGGDEFALIVRDVRSLDTLAQLAGTIQQAVQQAVSWQGSGMRVRVSVGISLFPEDGAEADQLLRQAVIALERAEQTSEHYAFFAEEMRHRLQRRQRMREALARALEAEQFELYYQPQVELANGHIVGVEALLRWRHPEHGLMSPEAFIDVAEESGLIMPLGAWVLEQACSQQSHWRRHGLNVRMAVNLSAVQLRDKGLPDMLGELMRRHALEPGMLELELTESALMDDPDACMVLLKRMKEQGVRLAMDDFGTGYSSLAYLKRFDIDTLKIDRTFVQGLPGDDQDAAIAITIMAMAKTLELRVLAEGVETAEQLKFLREFGCDEVQGYYFGRPMPAGEMVALLRQRQAPPLLG